MPRPKSYCSKVYMKDIMVSALDRMLSQFPVYEEMTGQEKTAKWHLEQAYELLTKKPLCPQCEEEVENSNQHVSPTPYGDSRDNGRTFHWTCDKEKEDDGGNNESGA